MVTSQLNIFSYFNESIEKGFTLLSELKFAEAKIAFGEVLEQSHNDTEALRGIELCSSWDEIKEHCAELPFNESVRYLHIRMEEFFFNNSTPDKVLHQALKVCKLHLMMQAGLFELPSGMDMADIAIEIKKESLVIAYFENKLLTYPGDARMRARLADLQWLTDEIAAAKNNYTMALLSRHNEIDIEKIQHRNLKAIIAKHGTEMACAYACLNGELPFPQEEYALNRKCHEACMLVIKENKLTIRENKEEVLKLRKQIKQTDEDFFRVFMQRKSFFEP